jgi:hypothetical protein
MSTLKGKSKADVDASIRWWIDRLWASNDFPRHYIHSRNILPDQAIRVLAAKSLQITSAQDIQRILESKPSLHISFPEAGITKHLDSLARCIARAVARVETPRPLVAQTRAVASQPSSTLGSTSLRHSSGSQSSSRLPYEVLTWQLDFHAAPTVPADAGEPARRDTDYNLTAGNLGKETQRKRSSDTSAGVACKRIQTSGGQVALRDITNRAGA